MDFKALLHKLLTVDTLVQNWRRAIPPDKVLGNGGHVASGV